MKIYDCFLFNDEEELLEVRLHEFYELWPEFDVYHVLIESPTTFQGSPKTLHYSSKLHWLFDHDWPIFSDFPGPLQATNPWARERESRTKIDKALVSSVIRPAPDDLIFITDADEIPVASKIDDILVASESGPVTLPSPQHYYDLTTQVGGYVGHRSKALRYRDLAPLGASVIADTQYLNEVLNANWHFSCLGGPTRVLEKLRSFSHTELQDNPDWVTLDNVCRLIKYKLDLIPPPNDRPLLRVPLAGPNYLLENLDRWSYLLDPLFNSLRCII